MTLRLTLYFSVTMAIVLYCVSGMLYSTMRTQLNQKDEQELKSSLQFQGKIASIISQRRGIEEPWQTELLEFVALQERLSLRIISPDGRVYSQTKNMRIPRSDFLEPTKAFSYSSWRYHAGGHTEKYLITSTLFKLNDNQKWVVQAALNVSKNNKIIESYYHTMQVFAAIAIAAFAAIGYCLARRGLSPLRKISSAIARIHAEDLHRRISTQRWPNELNELATSFDQMMTRLEASFQQLNRFSSDIAHELRAPINNLISVASVTQSKDRSRAEYQDALAEIVEEGERLSRTISSMLFLARADNRREILSKETLRSQHEFEKLIDFYDVLAEEKNISLKSTGDIILRADPHLLQRALSNLLSNAIRHTGLNGQIILSAHSDEHFTYLSVKDNGEGIAAGHLPYIFDRFYRIDVARTEAENTGLGLSIVKTITELHHGKVLVESATAAGCLFTIVLPRD
ncbi:heavy metal sensor histidine kinase [Erwinia sp. HDF1-3R]|uniref:heavy metal sensor histidine kinase n=1 Tax=Erwinia sp. HDF1-3R TaxID=3141543 RepID=UPI0031F4B3EC